MLGIDPGSRRTGYGIVSYDGSQTLFLECGCITTKTTTPANRLGEIFSGVRSLITEYAPDEVAIEQVFVSKNAQSALKLGQARGAALVAAVEAQLPIYEYAARLVKQSVVGTGRASKAQVQHMVQVVLSLSAQPSSDAADALAIALCHVNTHYSQLTR
ncbi:MAG: crossover junction endodeoxyribonuclease RuvC [Pseudomonadota bacterium]